MKENLHTTIAFILLLAFIPCLAYLTPEGTSSAKADDITVGVYFTKEKKCVDYSLEEYVIGAVMAQMPADFETEALKAQAVLARSYIIRRYQSEKESPTPALHGSLISDDENLYQSFFTDEQAKDFYGEGYSAARDRITKAVRSAKGILTYKGEPVIAAYHAASSGYTESAKTAWGQDIPYLKSVKSENDAKLKGIETVTTLSLDEFDKLVYRHYGISTGGSAQPLTTSANKHGYVTSLSICGSQADVQEFISLMEIASPCFEFEIKDGNIIFTAKGFGHMVGMSQYGANLMALDGADYKEILAYYYKNVKLSAAEV